MRPTGPNTFPGIILDHLRSRWVVIGTIGNAAKKYDKGEFFLPMNR
jgi:hypothetical protein